MMQSSLNRVLIISLAILICDSLIITPSLASDCPPSSEVRSCSPKCKDDFECSRTGTSCCPNICNYKSCVPPGLKAKNTGYKSSTSGSGTYCGNLKCSPFEKCVTDRASKRPTCVRA